MVRKWNSKGFLPNFHVISLTVDCRLPMPCLSIISREEICTCSRLQRIYVPNADVVWKLLAPGPCSASARRFHGDGKGKPERLTVVMGTATVLGRSIEKLDASSLFFLTSTAASLGVNASTWLSALVPVVSRTSGKIRTATTRRRGIVQ